MEDGARRRSSRLKKHKSSLTSTSARSPRPSSATSGKRLHSPRIEVDGNSEYLDISGPSQLVQRRDLSASTATGDQGQTGNEVYHGDLPGRQSIITEASSMWVDSSKLFSMAVQPTEGAAHLNTQNLATGASLGNISNLDRGDDDSEVMELNPPIGNDLGLEQTLPTGDPSRQNHAASPRTSGGGDLRGPPEHTSSYRRRWGNAPTPPRILDDSALEIDQSQQRHPKPSRLEKEKRLKSSDGAKLQSRSTREADIIQALNSDHLHAPWTPKHGRGHEESGANLAIGAPMIQTAAKQTGFLQRHVSAKAERHSHKLNEDNLNSLQPRKEQRIDPKERIIAWIEQGEAYLRSTGTSRGSTQDFGSASSYSAVQPSASLPPATPKKESRKRSKASNKDQPGGGGLFSCFGCFH